MDKQFKHYKLIAPQRSAHQLVSCGCQCTFQYITEKQDNLRLYLYMVLHVEVLFVQWLTDCRNIKYLWFNTFQLTNKTMKTIKKQLNHFAATLLTGQMRKDIKFNEASLLLNDVINKLV